MEIYPWVKQLHIATVVISGSLFLIRGVAVQAGASWAMSTATRYLSYSIDTVLLLSALILVTILPATVFANGWLTAKLVLLVAYIVAGSYALKRGRTRAVRLGFLTVAVAVFSVMLSVALTHHPLGIFGG